MSADTIVAPTSLHVWRVAMVNSRGLTCGPMFATRPTRWSATVTAECDRGHQTPPVDCTCGIYGTATPEALDLVVESAASLLRAARWVPHLEHPYVIARDDSGMPVLVDRKTAVVVLEGELQDAYPRSGPPVDLVPVTRRMLQPAAAMMRGFGWINRSETSDETVWLGMAEGSEPAGTWRGARFTATSAHAVGRKAPWLEQVMSLPIYGDWTRRG